VRKSGSQPDLPIRFRHSVAARGRRACRCRGSRRDLPPGL
jgi:hypothetical protein